MPIHLIRHGEVQNPHGIHYADIPGFFLSEEGRLQARDTGAYLSGKPPRLIVSSPLDRAVETSQIIAAATGSEVTTDARLMEWNLALRWRGAVTMELPQAFPGELEAYLADPTELPFSPESIADVADRICATVADFAYRVSGDVAFVSHQDPIHAAALHLAGEQPADFHADKPTHCSVTTLVPGSGHWSRAAYWAPDQ